VAHSTTPHTQTQQDTKPDQTDLEQINWSRRRALVPTRNFTATWKVRKQAETVLGEMLPIRPAISIQNPLLQLLKVPHQRALRVERGRASRRSQPTRKVRGKKK